MKTILKTTPTVKKLAAVAFAFLIVIGILGYKEGYLTQKEPPKEINISVLPGLQFSLPRFHVVPGQQVVLRFTNTDDMDHNLLVIRPKSREKVVNLAAKLGAEGVAKSYIPETDDVMWHTSVLHADQTETLSFTAPSKDGVYPYVCTLPGHGHVMYGAMYVNESGEMPVLTEDKAVPHHVKNKVHVHAETNNHPYELVPPYYYRLYIDGASPAAIAVHLPGNISFCWDATPCQMRFVWKDGFVDNTELWKGHKDAKAKIEGTIVYRETRPDVLTIGEQNTNKNPPKFKGYRVTDGGYLEFCYIVEGIEIFETIRELENKNGIVRHFRIPTLDDNVVFHHTKEKKITCYYNGVPLPTGPLVLDKKNGKQFSVEFRIEK